MADPQLENGHLRIANEVWEHLTAAGLNGTQLSVVMAVIRKTWGFHKKAAPISLTEFAKLTNHGKRNIIRALSKLIEMNIVQRASKSDFHSPAQWGVVKDWESWGVVKRATGGQTGNRWSNRHQGGGQTGTKGVVKQAPTKRQVKDTLKDTISAERISAPDGDKPFIEIPTKSGESCFVMLSKVREWDEAFPNLNVREQVKVARQWCIDNPNKRKTKTGINKFLFGWLSRQKPESKRKSGADRLRELKELRGKTDGLKRVRAGD